MEVYVASPATRNLCFINELSRRLNGYPDIKPFFPAHLGDYTGSNEEMLYIEEVCRNSIAKCDVMIAVYPFGLSVSNEIGRFIVYREMQPEHKRKLIIWDTSLPESKEAKILRSEAMIMPCIDVIVHDIDELIESLQE